MNILMLGRWLPAPRRPEAASRAHRFAQALARRHHVTLAFTTDEANPAGAVSALRTEFPDLEFATVPRGWKCLASAVRLATGESCTLAYFRSDALAQRLADRVRSQRYDAIWVTSSSMIQYALDLPPAVPIVMDFGDIDSEWWRRQAARRPFPGAGFYRTEGAKLRLAEGAIARRAVHSVVASPRAARALGGFAPAVATTLIPDGVDVEYWSPAGRLPTAPTVGVIGQLDSEREIDRIAEFCRAVTPVVRARVPECQFVIIAADPAPGARRLAEIPGVTVARPAPDMRPTLHRCAVAASPVPATRGLGALTLHAMASAVPVVATAVAVEGLAAVSGRDIFVEDAAGAFAHAVTRLLENPALRAEMGTQGCALVRSEYAWSQIAERAAALTDDLASPTNGPTPAAPASVEALAR